MLAPNICVFTVFKHLFSTLEYPRGKHKIVNDNRYKQIQQSMVFYHKNEKIVQLLLYIIGMSSTKSHMIISVDVGRAFRKI